jgi:hypothetical protein
VARVSAEPLAAVATPPAPARRPRILLVHGNAPWQPNGGGVFLEEMCAHAACDFAHLTIGLEGRAYEVPRDFPRPVIQLAARGGLRGMGVLKRTLPVTGAAVETGVVRPLQLRRRLRAVRDELVSFAPDRLVLFMNAVEVSMLAPALLRLLPVPYVTMEWDLLEAGVQRAGGGRTVTRRMLASVDRLRRGAAARGVASEGMAAHYRRAWGLDSVVLRQTIRPARRERSSDGDVFRLAICGNVYAEDEFRALLAALGLTRWRLGGRPAELHVIGVVPPSLEPLPPQVRVTGWVSYERSLEMLGDMDMGYCPLWFDPEHPLWVETCFPSKLISYMAAEVPVFYHGPASGTPARFIERYPVGTSCHTWEPGAIARALDDAASSPEMLRRAREAVRDVVAHEFAPEILRSRLRAFLNVPAEAE